MKKFISLFTLLLSVVMVLSSCSEIATDSKNKTDAATFGIEKANIETDAVSDGSTTSETSPVTTLPEKVEIETTKAPVTEPVPAASVVTNMTSAANAPVATTAAPLVTTAATTTTAAPILPKASPISTTYSYSKLSEAQKVVYNKILTAAKAHQTIVTFDQAPSIDTVTNIYSLIYSEEINMQYMADSFKYDTNPVKKMQISYKYSTDTMTSIDAQTQAKANQIVAQITPTMTTFDILKYFHDYIITNCTYDLNEEFQFSAYGALVKGRATCQGYSHAMALLCNKVGIQNTFVTGNTGEAHMWNLINVNGNWYHMDTTWDDPDRGDYGNLVMYDYFNVPTSNLSARTISPGYIPLPAATAIQDNFFVHNGLYATTIAEAEQILFNEYINASKNKQTYVNIKFSDPNVFKAAYTYFFTDQAIFTIQESASNQAVNKFVPDNISLIQNAETMTYTIIFSY